MPRRRTKYEDLAILPTVAAEHVCAQKYTGAEWSMQNCPSNAEIAKIEKKRQAMTPEQIREFADICDARCKKAYELKVEWFQKIVEARGNKGRDQLYVWLTHWMTSYLMNPEGFRRLTAPVGFGVIGL